MRCIQQASIQRLATIKLGNDILQTVGQDGVEVLFLLQFLGMTRELVEDALGHGKAASIGIVGIVFAGKVFASTDLKNIHEGVFALVSDADKELQVVGRMLRIVENKNLLSLLAEQSPSFQGIAAERDRDAIGIALILQSFLKNNQVDAFSVRETNTGNKTILFVQIV